MFGDKKNIKTEELTSGCRAILGSTQMQEVVETYFSEGMTPLEYYYYQGFIAGLIFAGVPKDKDVFGLNPREYADNFLCLSIKKDCNTKLRECAKAILSVVDGDDDAE